MIHALYLVISCLSEKIPCLGQASVSTVYLGSMPEPSAWELDIVSLHTSMQKACTFFLNSKQCNWLLISHQFLPLLYDPLLSIPILWLRSLVFFTYSCADFNSPHYKYLFMPFSCMNLFNVLRKCTQMYSGRCPIFFLYTTQKTLLDLVPPCFYGSCSFAPCSFMCPHSILCSTAQKEIFLHIPLDCEQRLHNSHHGYLQGLTLSQVHCVEILGEWMSSRSFHCRLVLSPLFLLI